MKFKMIKQGIFLVAFVAVIGSLSSCNRGYGCPSNFSIEETAVKVVKNAAQSVVNITQE